MHSSFCNAHSSTKDKLYLVSVIGNNKNVCGTTTNVLLTDGIVEILIA